MQNPQRPQNPPQNPQDAQPAPAPPSGQPAPPAQPGGYGYPQQAPQLPHQGGYGYPQQAPPGQAEAQLPTQSFVRPQQAPQQPAQPHGGFPPPSFNPSPGAAEPDWAAMADDHAAQQRRKRRFRLIGIIAAACLLGAGVGELAVNGFRGKPTAKGSPTGSARPSASASKRATPGSPTVPGQPNLIADRSGQANLAMGPDAVLNKVVDGYALRLRSDGNSYAESAEPVLDVTKSFSLSAWVFNEAGGGIRTVFSQGDGISFSFDLGRGVNGQNRYWFFKVQTGTGGADSTTYEVDSSALPTFNQWVLLTATYDASAHKIALYGNGRPLGSTKVPALWSGPGPFEIGRNRHHGMWTEFFAGVISHVQVWNAALTPDDVTKIKDNKSGLTAKPIASWLVG
jgi:hypothetical protein